MHHGKSTIIVAKQTVVEAGLWRRTADDARLRVAYVELEVDDVVRCRALRRDLTVSQWRANMPVQGVQITHTDVSYIAQAVTQPLRHTTGRELGRHSNPADLHHILPAVCVPNLGVILIAGMAQTSKPRTSSSASSCSSSP